jgi:uncharacterized membrane protein
MNDWISLLTFASALGCGLIAGVFFAFSSFVMRALARLPPARGVAAMLVTIVFHIPWNNSLAAAEPSSPQAAAEWALYLVRWTFWNHVRGGAALAAAALLIVALRKSTC